MFSPARFRFNGAIDYPDGESQVAELKRLEQGCGHDLLIGLVWPRVGQSS
jgi:hypothetical protein